MLRGTGGFLPCLLRDQVPSSAHPPQPREAASSHFCFKICKQLRLDTLCCQIQWSDTEREQVLDEAATATSTCGRVPGPRRAAAYSRSCPSDLGWDGHRQGTGLTPPLACLISGGWLLYFHRDSGLSAGEGHKLFSGVVPSFRQCHRGTGQFAGTEGLTVAQISKKAEWTSGRDPGGCSHLPAAPSLACAGERDPQGRQGR